MMVTTVGLLVDRIPVLDILPLGGRLKRCIDGWCLITSNSWLCNVEYGYKIPLKFIPKQRIIPTNPKSIGPAYDILVSETNDLKAKEAVVAVSHTPGEYIISYFEVPKPR